MMGTARGKEEERWDHRSRCPIDRLRRSICFVYDFCRKKTKDKRKKRSHKGRGLARCRHRKIDAMIAVELGARARNWSNFADRFLWTRLLL